MGKRHTIVAVLCLLVVLFLTTPVQAQWTDSGEAVCTASDDQSNAVSVPDGEGGAFVAWTDNRGGNSDIYAQRIDKYGYVQWASNGVAVCAAAGDQILPRIMQDGLGGVVIAWSDFRVGSGQDNSDVYAQKLDANGNATWIANGEAVCTAIHAQTLQALASDLGGGAFFVWSDNRAVNTDVYAQRANASGTMQWATDGVAVCTAAYSQSSIDIAEVTFGVMIVWQDFRTNSNWDIYAQRIDTSGSVGWAANGIAICAESNMQLGPKIVSNGSGTAVVVWEDYRNGNGDIFAQQVGLSGAQYWTADGISVCSEASTQSNPQSITDGGAGAFIVWEDSRGAGLDIYAQKISNSGTKVWPGTDGVAVCTANNDQVSPQLYSDAAGGAVFTWADSRFDHIYAQRYNPSGSRQWIQDGVELTPGIFASQDQSYPTIVADADGAAIVAWTDARNFSDLDIYAQRIEKDAYRGYSGPHMTSISDVPNDQGGKIELQWERSYINNSAAHPSVTKYSIWRHLLAQGSVVANTSGPTSNGASAVRGSISQKVRFLSQAGIYAWEWLADIPLRTDDTYAYMVQSRYDSSGTDTGWQYFVVTAHTSDPFVYYDSPVDSGYSVDNLAPPPPSILAVQRVGSDVELSWSPSGVNEPDFKHYNVYRSDVSGVTPDPLFLLSSSADASLTDAGAPSTELYYIVTAQDVNENESDASNEAMVSPVTGVDGRPPTITSLTVLANSPNPFTQTTLLHVGLPNEADVTIEIYDVAGRRVHATTQRLRGGWQSISFDGRDASGRLLPSGVYFYRVHTFGEHRTRKMVIRR